MKIFRISIGFLRRYIYVFFSYVYLFTVGWLRPKNRILLYQLCEHFGYDPYGRLLPKVSLDKVISNDLSLHLHHPLAIPGSVSVTELLVITSLIRTYRPVNLFEFGTSFGRTTLNMAANLEHLAQLYTLDLSPSETIGSLFANTVWANGIIQLYGDSGSYDFLPFKNSMDFIFVDADHSYNSVINDSKQALQLLRNGRGIILWHDYGGKSWPDSTQALNMLYTSEPGFEKLQYIDGTTLAYLDLR